MIDLDALERAGISNAQGRATLLSYLDELGFTAEEMVAAEREGRLFGLAGDVLLRSGHLEYSLRTAAEAIGQPLDAVAHAWAALGLTVANPDQIVLSQADVDGLATWASTKALVGDDAALGLLRVMGAAMARFAEALSSVVRVGLPDIQLTHTEDELATATAFRDVVQLIPRTGAMLDAVLRHHLVGARVHFEGVTRDTSATVVCGVGFVDLSGFTALTQTLTPGELSGLLNGFSAAVDDVVHADGGRVVKFIGDAVMWVSSTPEQLVCAARDLVDYPKAKAEGLQVRAGLAFGQILAINGDYFGNAVNLAARLVGAAEPGEILAAPEVHAALPDWPATASDPLTLKGFDAPITAYALSHQGEYGVHMPVAKPPLDAILQKVLEAVPFQLTTDGGADACRQRFRDLPRIPMYPEVRTEDLTIDGPAGPIPLRLYRPSDPDDGPLPVVMFFHGGGWVVGDLDTYDNAGRQHAAGSGALVVSVDYRLAPEHPFPAAVEDVWAATRWVAEHAADLGADPNRLAVAGDSAGGNLAAVVAQLARDAGGPGLRFQLLWYPATTWDTSLPSFSENADAPILSTASVAGFSRWYAGHVDLKHAPATLIPGRATSFVGLPPAYIAVAGYDPLRDDGVRYGELLAAAGVPVEVQDAASLVHGYISYEGVVPAATDAVHRALAALRAALA